MTNIMAKVLGRSHSYLLLLLCITSRVQAMDYECQVIEGNSAVLTNCSFPFKFENQLFYGCITNADPEGKLWCSTKTNPDTYEHIEGNGYWGHCDSESCPKDQDFNDSNEIALEFEKQIEQLKSDANTRSSDILCPCIDFRECKWSSELIGFANRINKRHPAYAKVLSFIRKEVCDPGTFGVNCCGHTSAVPSSTTSAIPSQSPEATSTPELTSTDAPQDQMDLGTWIPTSSEKCGTRINPLNVVGGKNAPIGYFPFVALLGFRKEENNQVYFTCGGSVLNKWYIMTAAHCFINDYPVEIRLGEHIVGSDPDCTNGNVGCSPKLIVRKPAKVIIHEGYNSDNPASINDIALIRVDEAIPLHTENKDLSGVMPVCIPFDEDDEGRVLRENDQLVVVGWGKVTKNRRITQENYLLFQVAIRHLQQATVPAVSRLRCEKIEIYSELDPTYQLCAGGEPGVDSCNGDSGGPLVYQGPNAEAPWYQVGIVSFGTKECGKGTPGVYTRVTAYLDWIKEKLEP